MIFDLTYYFFTTTLVVFVSLAVFIILISLYIKWKFEPVKRECTSNLRLDNKIALVTGGNAGIGLETARDLAARGARVIIACRNQVKAAEAIADITQTTGNKNIEYRYLDLAKFSSVRQFAAEFNKSYDHLHILVNNAGCARLQHEATEDGIDIVMQVNYFGPFLLTRLLLNKMLSSKPSRIVIVSSCLHNFARLNISDLQCITTTNILFKYANSKLCDVLWTKALAKRLPEGITVNALHPGLAKTDIFSDLPSVINKIVLIILGLIFRTTKECAQTTIHLCVSDEVENISGKYFMECKEAEYSRRADDQDLVEKVWEKSMMMTS